MKIPWFGKDARRSDGLRALARRRIGGAESIDAIAAALRTAGFSPAAYRAANEDLLAALADDEQALWHFLAYCRDFTHLYPITPRPDGFARLCELRLPSCFKADVLANMLSGFSRPGGALWSMPIDDRRCLLGDLRASVVAVGSLHCVIGDSHSNLYRHPIATEPGRGSYSLPLHILCTGSSAKGLANRASRSGSGARLAAMAKYLAAEDMEVFFKFGQVDVEFAFSFDRIRAGAVVFEEADFVRFCGQSTKAYMCFLAEHFAPRHVNVMSIFPPALSDAAWRDGYTNAQIVAVETEQGLEDVIAGIRNLEIPSLVERTRHHAIFNEMLETQAADAGFAYFDDFASLIGPAGTLDPRYIPTHQGSDHHLEHVPTTDVLSSLVSSHLASKKGAGGPADTLKRRGRSAEMACDRRRSRLMTRACHRSRRS